MPAIPAWSVQLPAVMPAMDVPWPL